MSNDQEMTKNRLIVWRDDAYGHFALYFGNLYVGKIKFTAGGFPGGGTLYHDDEEWEAWFVEDDDGDYRIGWFGTELEARIAVENALLQALPEEIALLVVKESIAWKGAFPAGRSIT
jgi:hypothetical protein